MFDIASLDTRTRAIAGVEMPLLNPRSGAPLLRDDGKPVTITFLGPASDIRKFMQCDVNNRRMDIEAHSIQCTDHNARRDGQAFPFSSDNARVQWAVEPWGWLDAAGR